MRSSLLVQGDIGSHRNGSVWRLFLQHMEIAFPSVLQTASSAGLFQFAVLKPAQNPSDSLVSRAHQEALGSFVGRYLKISWYVELCQDIMASSQLSHSPCYLYLPQPLHSLCYTKLDSYSARLESFLITITARLGPTVPGSKLNLEAVKVHLKCSSCMKGEKPHTLIDIYLASSPKGVLLNAPLLPLFFKVKSMTLSCEKGSMELLGFLLWQLRPQETDTLQFPSEHMSM